MNTKGRSLLAASGAIALLVVACTERTTTLAVRVGTITHTEPADGASGVAVDVRITIAFSRVVEAPARRVVGILNGEPLLVGTVEGATATLFPLWPLEHARIYSVTVHADRWPESGLEEDYTWSFSTDPGPAGVSWSVVESGTTVDLLSIARRAGVFYAAGSGGTLLVSRNGRSWTSQTAPSGDFIAIRAPSLFYLIDAEGAAFASSDGVSWSVWEIGVEGFLPRAVAQSTDALIVVGAESGDPTRGMAVRFDGAVYEVADPGEVGALTDVLWSSYYARYFAVGAGGTLLSSGDGLEWVPAPPPGDAPGSFLAVTHRSGYSGQSALLVAVGERIATSADGRSWSTRLAPPGTLFDVQWHGHRFVAVGAGGLILESEDGFEWTQRPSGVETPLRAVSGTLSPLVAVGQDGTILISPAATLR